MYTILNTDLIAAEVLDIQDPDSRGQHLVRDRHLHGTLAKISRKLTQRAQRTENLEVFP